MTLEQYGSQYVANPPKVVGLLFGHGMNLFVMSAELLEDIYIHKNNFYDKSPLSQMMFAPYLGESTLLIASNDVWRNKRKAMSSAFYKSKLEKILENVKAVMDDKLLEWEQNYASQD